MRVASGKWEVGPKQWREVIGWPKIGEAGLVERWTLKIGGRLAPQNSWD